MKNLECTPESTELFSHSTYLPLKDAINIVKHQHTPGTKSSSCANSPPGKNNLLEDDKAASTCKSKHSIKRDL